MEIRFDVLLTQIIGFLIVLWVLKRFAWGPVLGMLEERRMRIANEVAASERLRKEAEALKADYENQLRTIEAQAPTASGVRTVSVKVNMPSTQQQLEGGVTDLITGKYAKARPSPATEYSCLGTEASIFW